MNRVVITGMGWVTPMGHAIDEVWPRLLAGESGIARTTIFDAATFPTRISAEVKNFNLKSHVSDLTKHPGVGRNTKFALAACAQAWRMARLPEFGNRQSAIGNLDLDRVGIYLGAGEGELDFAAYTTAALSSWQAESQPSPALLLPSSQVSSPRTLLSPQISVQRPPAPAVLGHTQPSWVWQLVQPPLAVALLSSQVSAPRMRPSPKFIVQTLSSTSVQSQPGSSRQPESQPSPLSLS